MLAAILPQGDRAWFFKVVGPVAVVDRQAQAVDAFFASLRASDEQTQPVWKLPDGWTEQASSGMRAATIDIPTGEQPLELTVVALPWTGGAGDVLGNVNRWRGQLQLPPIGPQDLAECTRELSADDLTVTIVDLRGRMQDTGMVAPFAGGSTAGAPPAAVSSQPPRAAAAGVPQFDAPDNWQPLPVTPPRKASFRITDGAQEALVTVIDFPATAGPMIADPLENLNRWRREVGLPEIAAKDLGDASESIVVAGRPASYFEVLPDADDPGESKIDRATLAVMLSHGRQIWFFKFHGDRELVAAERGQFRSFVDSVKFADDEGADDGN